MPITIVKAIEILSDSADRGTTTFNQYHRDAQRLGIEALKRIMVARKLRKRAANGLLSGETKTVY